MEDRELQRLLQSQRDDGARGWRCPDENEVAQYVDAQLVGDSKRRFEAHLAKCAKCRNLVGFLALSNEELHADPVPPHLLVRARDLVGTRSESALLWRWPIVTAAAAVAILVLALIGLRFRNEQNSVPESGQMVAEQHQPGVATDPGLPRIASPTVKAPNPPSAAPANKRPTVRGTADPLRPALLSPREGAQLKRDRLDFRWKSSVEAVFYELKLVNEDGSIVFQRSNLNETQLRIPNEVQLVPGKKYFASVVAHTRDGRIQKSDLVKFQITK